MDLVYRTLLEDEDETVAIPSSLGRLLLKPLQALQTKLPVLPFTNPLHTVDYIDEISRDKLVPPGARGYADLDIVPQKVRLARGRCTLACCARLPALLWARCRLTLAPHPRTRAGHGGPGHRGGAPQPRGRLPARRLVVNRQESADAHSQVLRHGGRAGQVRGRWALAGLRWVVVL